MATQEPSDHDSDVAWQIARCCYNDDYLTAHLQISEILTEEYGTLAADVERLREVWGAYDQTLICNHCGWVDWDGPKHWEHNPDCAIGFLDKRYADEKAKVERLRAAATGYLRMLESLASTPYRQCGGDRLLCVQLNADSVASIIAELRAALTTQETRDG